MGPLAVFRVGGELRGPRRAAGIEPLLLAPAGGASVEPPGRQESGRGSPLAMGGAGRSEHGGRRPSWSRCQGALAGSGAWAGRTASGEPSPGVGGSPGPGSRGSALGASRGTVAVGGRGSAVREAGARGKTAAEQEAGGREKVSPLLTVFPGVQRVPGPEARGFCRRGRAGCGEPAPGRCRARPGRGEPPGSPPPPPGPRPFFEASPTLQGSFLSLSPSSSPLFAGRSGPGVGAQDISRLGGEASPPPPDELWMLAIIGEHLGAGSQQASP